MKRYFIIIITATFAALGCQRADSDDTAEVVSSYITVSADIASTRSVSKSTFVDGDAVSVWAWTDEGQTVVDGVTNSYDGDTWSPNTPMVWWDMTTKHRFIATYPAQSVDDFSSYTYTLEGNGAAQDDILVAINSDGLCANDAKVVDLSFSHMMSKVTISLSYRTQFDTIPVVESLTLTAGNMATIDLTTQTAELSSEATIGEFQIMETKASLDFEGVVVPQDIRYINIKLKGYEQTTTYDHGGLFSLIQGTNHAISLIIGKDKVELGEDLQVLTWDDDNILEGGDADDSSL